jgi:hypothetical protein
LEIPKPIHVPDDQIRLEKVGCPKCGSSEWNLLFNAKDRLTDYAGVFGVVRCRKCSLVYLNPRPTRGSLKHFYPHSYYGVMERLPGVEAFTLGGAIRAAQLHTVLDYPSAPILESFPLIRLACHPKLKWLWRFSYSVRPRGIEFIPRYIPHGKILSVGFGGIAELESLRKLGWEVWGIDVDEELVRGARENGFSASVAPSISDAGLPDNSFDAVLMSHVLEHLSDPFTEIAEVMRVLKPGGLFQVVVPRHDSLYASLFGRFRYQAAQGKSRQGRILYCFDIQLLHGLWASLWICLCDFRKLSCPLLYS